MTFSITNHCREPLFCQEQFQPTTILISLKCSIRGSNDETKYHVDQPDDVAKRRMYKLAEEIAALQQAKEEAVANQEFDQAAQLLNKEREKRRELAALRNSPSPLNPDDDTTPERMREFFSPPQIDHQIRQAMRFCWMALPKEKRNVDEVERQIHRLVDRALRDLREDCDEFFGKKGAE